MLSDYGAFRDLQRHRLLTIEWQPLTPRHGYTRPELVDEAGGAAAFDAAMGRSATLYDALVEPFPEQAPYAVCMAYRVRYAMQLNAREAMHLLELRSAPQGHPAYRRIALDMHRQIAEQAGHRAIAAADAPREHGGPRARAPGVRAAGRAAPHRTTIDLRSRVEPGSRVRRTLNVILDLHRRCTCPRPAVMV